MRSGTAAFEVYLPVLLVGTLPWSRARGASPPADPAARWRRVRGRLRERNRDWLLLAYWLLLPLAVFFLARSRLQLYVLPLFVPLALIMARPLAGWPGLRGPPPASSRSRSRSPPWSALKGALAYWPSDRDARALAAAARSSCMDPHEVDEIVFVDMRPFYGLNVYLDKPVEGVEIGERRFEYSKFVTHEDLCAELGQTRAHRLRAQAARTPRNSSPRRNGAAGRAGPSGRCTPTATRSRCS